MRILLSLWFTQVLVLAAPPVPISAQISIPDGQILAIPVKIFVSTNLDASAKPRLQLASYKTVDRSSPLDEFEPFIVAPNQTWTEQVGNQAVSRTGTLLMFDLNNYSTNLAWYKSAIRVTPVLSWEPANYKTGDLKPALVGPWVYLGRRSTSAIWTLLTVGILTGSIWRLAKAKKSSVLYLISGEDGYLSLWRTQLAAWTIAVGTMVFLFGLIQFGVPRIPDSLVVLMGMSIATGSLSAIAGKTPTPSVDQPPPQPQPPHTPEWADLISSFNQEIKQMVLSVPKAQMVFWTGIILVLFVVKSILRGELWEVPWELVTLTGVSQAGYVSDKALQRPKPDKE